MDREGLISSWHKLYGTTPPTQMSRKLLIRALAYRLQEQTSGGLRPSTRRLLSMAVKENGETKPDVPAATLSPGTRLIREWQGHSYEVTIMEKGVMFQGKQYGSLTKVAGIITGIHWSGPSFFGLRTRKKEGQS